jgi:hypothetical protein
MGNNAQVELQSRLVGLVRSSAVLMRAPRAVQTVDPPDWLIGAGAIRDRVRDHLHGFTRPAPTKDVDLAFFDPCSLGGERERGVHSAVTAQAPDICWDVTNQAAIHLWYPQVRGAGAAVEILRRRRGNVVKVSSSRSHDGWSRAGSAASLVVTV